MYHISPRTGDKGLILLTQINRSHYRIEVEGDMNMIEEKLVIKHITSRAKVICNAKLVIVDIFNSKLK